MKHSSTPTALIGYGRTSTVDQEAGLEAQRRDLLAAGCHEDAIFLEQLSSTSNSRPMLKDAMRFARRGDTFVVTKLDRLARSVADLVDIQRGLEAKGVSLRVLAMDGTSGELNSATPTGKLMLTMLGAIAQFERELMLERQREGIAKAKQEKRYKGRVPTARRQSATILRMHSEERKTVPEIVAQLGVSRASVFRVLKAAKEAAGT